MYYFSSTLIDSGLSLSFELGSANFTPLLIYPLAGYVYSFGVSQLTSV